MSTRTSILLRRLSAGALAAALALVPGVLAAWPIYRTPWLWIVALVALLLGAGLAWARERWRLSFPVFAALVLVAFALTVVPVAVPQSLTADPLRGLANGLAAVALGWKQLLTLDLPVGTYQSVLVPAYLVMLACALLAVFFTLKGGRAAPLAAIPMLGPVAFGTVFGASEVSPPLRLGPLEIVAPREVGLWLAVIVLAAVWIAWTAGAERRAALRLGRVGSEPLARRGGTLRAALGGGTLVIALAAGAMLAPMLDTGARAVPRDRVDPEIVVRDTPSPLAAYRNAKRDSAIDAELFAVSSNGARPERLRLAVLDDYDGVDFHVSGDAAGRFTRFPTGDRVSAPASVTVRVGEGYSDIWVPIAPLADPPRFSGPRAAGLADAFYVNRDTGTAIAIPSSGGERSGLREGDAYTARMETGTAAAELGEPVAQAPLIDLDRTPELAAWIDAQGDGSGPAALESMIEKLRDRGYLSHSLTDEEGERLWFTRLSEEYGARFESSAGGHSLARIEVLFEQLNSQQAAAGEKAEPEDLVAGIGDDEQFAAAAALIARSLGYESRVVVGVRLDAAAAVPGVPACEEQCTGGNLAAWIEVRGERGGWVPFDVTPQVEKAPQRLEEGERLPEFPTTPEERDAREVDPPIGLGEQSGGDDRGSDATGAFWLWPVLRAIGLALAALALLLLPLLFIPVAKRIRAKRRRGEQRPELSALGAWEEMVDRARDAGVAVPDGASRVETAAALGTAPAIWAADQVDRAVFSRGGAVQADADNLWAAVDADSDRRAAALGRGGRIRAAYSLRSYGIRLSRPRAGVEGKTT